MKNAFIQTVMLFVGFFPILGHSQVSDSFADSNLTSNPTWYGNTQDFIVNLNQQLQLNNSLSDTSSIYINNARTLHNEEWSLWAKLDFAPSSNNFLKVFLTSSSSNLDSSLYGYFLKIGENGAADNVDLWKQEGNNETLLISGTLPAGKNSNTLRIKVLRDSLGSWQLYTDTLGGYNFQLEGTALDTSVKESLYFGIYCRYTSSNAKKFYFDDVYAGPNIKDAVAPKLVSIEIIDSYILDLIFNEALDYSSAIDTSNYLINNGLGKPSSVFFDLLSCQNIRLLYSINFIDSLWHNITINNIKDIRENVNSAITDSFLYYIPKPYDIVLNEIMADPDPPVGLPNAEYIELYNNSAYAISLNNWRLAIGTSTLTFPSQTINSHDHLIITDISKASSFSSFGNVCGLAGFPGLNNDGTQIKLFDKQLQVIHSVNYDKNWYQNSKKADGGFSLEMIDPHNPCAEKNNWHHSFNLNGGTPGAINSVYGPNPDVDGPKITGISILDTLNIRLFFNELLPQSSINDTNKFTINNSISSPKSLLFGPTQNEINLLLSSPIKENIIYLLSIKNTLIDCSGNSYSFYDSLLFAIPQKAQRGEIIFNEVMYEAKENSVEFIEVFNPSDKFIDLGNLRISDYDSITKQVYNAYPLFERGHQIRPGEYKVFSSNQTLIRSEYVSNSDPQSFVDTKKLPALSNEGKAIALSDTLGNVIDWVYYNPDMHHPLLQETEGVSLERIDAQKSSRLKENWHSAASNIGYATPALENSHSAKFYESSGLSIVPEVFSPDLDGYNDFINISFQLDDHDYVGSIIIFNEKGIPVKKLVSSALLSEKGSFIWNGVDDNDQKLEIGIYIVYFEAFNPEGKFVSNKKTCVLSAKQ